MDSFCEWANNNPEAFAQSLMEDCDQEDTPCATVTSQVTTPAVRMSTATQKAQSEKKKKKGETINLATDEHLHDELPHETASGPQTRSAVRSSAALDPTNASNSCNLRTPQKTQASESTPLSNAHASQTTDQGLGIFPLPRTEVVRNNPKEQQQYMLLHQINELQQHLQVLLTQKSAGGSQHVQVPFPLLCSICAA